MSLHKVKMLDISMDIDIQGKNGIYKGTVLTYKCDDNKTKQKNMATVWLSKQGTLQKKLSLIESGEMVTLEIDKSTGFENIINVFREGEEVKEQDKIKSNEEVAKVTKQPYVPKSNVSSISRDWESKEERQARQVMIVRQSSLSTAVALAATNKEFVSSPIEIIGMAKQFESYVLGTKQDLDNLYDDL